MKKLVQKILAIAGVAGVVACGAPAPEEQIEAAQNGPIARALKTRFEETSVSAEGVSRLFTYEGEQRVPEPTVRQLQLARCAVLSCIESSHCLALTSFAPSGMDILEEVLIYSENRLTELGEPLECPLISMPTDGTVVAAPMVARRYGGEGGDEGGGGLNLNLDVDLAGLLSEIIDGIAGVASGLGQAVENVQSSMVCAIELGRRVLPGVLQVVDSDDTTVYDCRARCIRSSSAATIAWCFDEPHWFTGGGPRQVATAIGAHLLEMCNPIDALDVERSGGCLY